MAHIFADRVKETTRSIGTGDLVLAGAPRGWQAFAPTIGVWNTTNICIVEPSGAWEVCLATLANPTTLQRGALGASSTGARISLTAGAKDVFCTFPAAEIMRGTDINAALAARLANNQAAFLAAFAAFMQTPEGRAAFSGLFKDWMANLSANPATAGIGNPYNAGGVPAIVSA